MDSENKLVLSTYILGFLLLSGIVVALAVDSWHYDRLLYECLKHKPRVECKGIR